ncbi:amidohydrolase family protein [Rhizobium grahamii]|uniref:Metal-dependent hydrolase n=1 Tax=Rhizobium grahamii CCGE 502 TaxID=990285 RepID=S3I768_9HYPH|nr:amidohydrolase [Rhizobium grahamii]EPE95223.1 metal-dependent hydrolase [Rhizobium grahamii CCGE 502]
MLFDTHLHIVDRQALDYPWLSSAGDLNRDSLYEDYARDAMRCGISNVLHMEVDVAPARIDDETSYVRDVSRRPDSLVRGVIAACRPEEDGFAAYLEQSLSDPFVKGFRRVLHVAPDDTAMRPLFRENVRRLSGTRMTFDLCVFPHQFETVLALVDCCPDVRFILDHCANPPIKEGMSKVWRKGVTDFSQRPNVTAKISGVIAYGDLKKWSVDSLRPYVEHTIGSFGWDRVVWGSDWPVCTLGGGLTPWVAATHALTAGCSPEERDKFYQANAKRIWSI